MMTCEQARDLLPLSLTGDLTSVESGELATHLGECTACRRKHEALESVRRALDAPSPPEVAVDVASIYATVAQRQQRSAKRWRRVAYAGMAVAASLLLFTLFRLDFEAGNGQFIVSWGPRPQSAIPQPEERIAPVVAAVPAWHDLEDRLRILDDLVHAMKVDLNTRDDRRKEEIALVILGMERLKKETTDELVRSRRDFNTLYNAQFGSAGQ
jgi:Putative zinc-finger